MLLNFTKMHGLGNDFMVVDLISQRNKLNNEIIAKLGDRNFGVGFDQMLIVEPPHNPTSDFCYRIFNKDGSEVENCGNGARCFAKFVQDKKLTNKNKIIVDTKAGILELNILPDARVKVQMPKVEFNPEKIPFTSAKQKHNTYKIPTSQGELEIGAVSLGNPHLITLVDDVKTAPVASLGKELECHASFPKKVNVSFLQIVDRKQAYLRVFERGVGETLACGTAACASAVFGILNDYFDKSVTITLPGGDLEISWDKDKNELFLVGMATKVFEGKIYI